MMGVAQEVFDLELFAGSYSDPLVLTAQDKVGLVDLTGTSGKIYVMDVETGVKVQWMGTLQVNTPSTGKVTYTWNQDELPAGDVTLYLQLEITDGTGKINYFPHPSKGSPTYIKARVHQTLKP